MQASSFVNKMLIFYINNVNLLPARWSYDHDADNIFSVGPSLHETFRYNVNVQGKPCRCLDMCTVSWHLNF